MAMRILLIEDEAGIAEMVSSLTESFCSLFVWVDTLHGAIEKLTDPANSFDVVIHDLRLRDTSTEGGISAIKSLRKMANAPILVLSGNPSPDVKQRCLEAGADAFIEKTNAFHPQNKALLVAIQTAIIRNPKPRSGDFQPHVETLARLVKDIAA